MGNTVIIGRNRTITASVTRPNNSTTYTANTGLANATASSTLLTFPNFFSDNGCAVIQEAVCVSSQNATTKPDLELWLFESSVTSVDDNAAPSTTDAEMLTFMGFIYFNTSFWKASNAGSAAAGNSFCHIQNLSFPVNSGAASGGPQNTLYAIPIFRNTYVPVANEVITFRLKTVD